MSAVGFRFPSPRIFVPLLGTLLLPAACALVGRGEDPRTTARLLAEARHCVRAARWEEALPLLELLTTRPDLGPAAEEVALLRARALRACGRYRAALAAFTAFARRYPVSPHLPQVEGELFGMALELLEGRGGGFLGLPGALGFTLSGVEVLRRLREINPRGRYAQDALRLIAQAYFEAGDYERAEVEYRTLLEEYPQGVWAPLAEYRLPLCQLRRSRGAPYDRRLLEQALQGFQEYEARHPDGDYVHLARAHMREIHNLLAEKTYRIGRFYLREKHVLAAALTLARLLRRYPETAWAVKARELLGAVLRDHPDGPAARVAREALGRASS